MIDTQSSRVREDSKPKSSYWLLNMPDDNIYINGDRNRILRNETPQRNCNRNHAKGDRNRKNKPYII